VGHRIILEHLDPSTRDHHLDSKRPKPLSSDLASSQKGGIESSDSLPDKWPLWFSTVVSLEINYLVSQLCTAYSLFNFKWWHWGGFHFRKYALCFVPTVSWQEECRTEINKLLLYYGSLIWLNEIYRKFLYIVLTQCVVLSMNNMFRTQLYSRWTIFCFLVVAKR